MTKRDRTIILVGAVSAPSLNGKEEFLGLDRVFIVVKTFSHQIYGSIQFRDPDPETGLQSYNSADKNKRVVLYTDSL